MVSDYVAVTKYLVVPSDRVCKNTHIVNSDCRNDRFRFRSFFWALAALTWADGEHPWVNSERPELEASLEYNNLNIAEGHSSGPFTSSLWLERIGLIFRESCRSRIGDTISGKP